MQRWTTVVVAATSAAVAAVVSVATTLVVLRLGDSDDGSPAAVGATAGVTGVASRTRTGSGALDLPALFAQVGSGVVRVETTACVLGGAGSGFLVAPDLVTTAAHVVDGAHAIVLRRDDGTEVAARVVGIDTVHDVALVRASRPIDGHVFAFSAEQPVVGAEVAAVGYPLNGPLVPVRRTVTGLGQSLDVTGAGASGAVAGPDAVVEGLLRVDGGFEPGASGSPVLTATGAVVGFVEGRSRSDQDVGFAVSAENAAPLVAQWRTLTTTADVADTCADPVGPPLSRVVVRDESGSPPGKVVADVLGAYASAINSSRYEEAWAMLGENARRGRTFAEWAEAERTSQIFDAVVRQVVVTAPGTDPTSVPASGTVGTARGTASTTGRATPPGTPAGAPAGTPTSTAAPGGSASGAAAVVPGEGGRVLALVEFSSTQEDRLGSGGPTCSRWRLTYSLARSEGRWMIDDTAPATGYPQVC